MKNSKVPNRYPVPPRVVGRIASGVLVLAITGAAFGQAEPVSIDFAPAPAQIERPAPAVPISENMNDVFLPGENVHDLGAPTAAEIAEADDKARQLHAGLSLPPPRVGFVRELEAPLSVANNSAIKTGLADGRDLWTFAIDSPDAYGIRVHFTDFNVGGGSVIVYGDGPTGVIARGPYTATGPKRSGDFWTPSIPGETVFIEVAGTTEPVFTVAEILHFDRHPSGKPDEPEQMDGAGGLLPCHIDANCFAGDATGQDAGGQMNFMDGGGSFVCSGTLMNDFDVATNMPYFLTAFHCLSTQASVNTLEVVWNWESASCNGALPDYFDLDRSDGGTLLETNSTFGGNDMTFIRLDGPVFTARAGATTAGLPASFLGYHHPAGSWKRGTSMHAEANTNCTNLPSSRYHYNEQDSGVIEGGSSGSAIFDGSSRVMGQLYGVCCPASHGEDCVNSGCGNRDEYSTLYGKMSITWGFIDRWLEIGGTINVDGDYVGTEEGTPTRPFNTVTEGNNFAWNGSRIKIQGGSYDETLTFSKQLTIIGENGNVTIGQ